VSVETVTRRAANQPNSNKREHRARHCALFISHCHCCVESKRGRIRSVTYWQTTLAILAVLSVSMALAEDFKTTKGKGIQRRHDHARRRRRNCD
jgi:hypothetical protein